MFQDVSPARDTGVTGALVKEGLPSTHRAAAAEEGEHPGQATALQEREQTPPEGPLGAPSTILPPSSKPMEHAQPKTETSSHGCDGMTWSGAQWETAAMQATQGSKRLPFP